MKKPLIFFMLLLLAMGGGLYYQFLWPPSASKRAVEAALQQFAAAVETQDRAQVAAALDRLLADDALIRLDVEIVAFTQTTGRKPVAQDFDKAAFIAFIDNILYTVSDTHFYPKLQELSYRSDGSPMPAQMTSSARAEGNSYYAGVQVMMQFRTDSQCSGQVIFESDAPKLYRASCSVGLRMTPKPGVNQTLHDNETIRQILMK